MGVVYLQAQKECEAAIGAVSTLFAGTEIMAVVSQSRGLAFQDPDLAHDFLVCIQPDYEGMRKETEMAFKERIIAGHETARAIEHHLREAGLEPTIDCMGWSYLFPLAVNLWASRREAATLEERQGDE